ncbi:hypothetical protein ACL03H_20650 [Saccharopolyspora sp. MS10]|uniref:hypothetical protein n=1 Tax=Saccharopolyspora sp. MS10 TaxID=3385973 RepID=UPI00399F3B6C
MSSPGGPGNWGSPDNGGSGERWGGSGDRPPQQHPGAPQQQFARSPYQSGMEYQGFGTFQQPQSSDQWGASPHFPPPPPPGPRRSRRGPLIAALASGAVVVIATVTSVLLVNARQEQAAGPATPSSAPAPPPASSQRPTASAPPPEPVVPGWQVVAVPKRGAVYDAPLEWQLETPENIVGFGPPEDPVTMSGVAIFQEGFCPDAPGSYRAIAGSTGRAGTDDATVATDTARKFAELAYGGPGARIDLAPPRPVRLAGGIAASKVVATVVPAPGPCGSPGVVINVLATNNDGKGSVVHIAAADQGIPGAVPPEALDQVTASLRPAG